MIYVIKDKRTDEIYVGSDNIMRNLAPDEEDDFALLYVFPWSMSNLQGYLRPWILHEPGNYTRYSPKVLDVLEEMKSGPEPKRLELHCIYRAPEKLKKFEDGIRDLISYGLLEEPSSWPKTDIEWAEYEDDLYSSILSVWPQEYFDLGTTYLGISETERKNLKEIYSTKGSRQEEVFEEKGRSIPPELLPPRLRVLRRLGPDRKSIETPGFNDSSKVYPDNYPNIDELKKRIYKEFPLGSIWERTTVREKLDEIEKLLGLPDKLRTTDLKKYFDLRTPNNSKIQIISKKI